MQILLEFCQEFQSGHLRLKQSPEPAAESWALLAAPPNLKELVREEIRLLLIGLQQKAVQEGRYWASEDDGLKGWGDDNLSVCICCKPNLQNTEEEEVSGLEK